MSINNNVFSKLNVLPKILNVLSIIFLVATFLFSYLSNSSLKSLLNANENRYLSYQLSEELRLSSDHLTLMARAYAATSQPKYLAFFNNIIAIRNGSKARPENYQRVYWDMLMPSQSEAPFKLGEKKPLHTLLIENGFTEQEFQQLTLAQQESDTLIEIERQAFELIENQENSNPVINHKATSLLFSNDYFQAKAKIMSYINNFYLILETRTRDEVLNLKIKHDYMLFWEFAGFIGLVSCLIANLYLRERTNQQSVKILEHEVNQQTQALKLTNTDLNQAITDMELARKQLVEAEKMASLGSLVAGVAHEVNTPLGISVTLASHLQENVGKLLKSIENDTLKRSQLDNFLTDSQSSCDLLLNNTQRAADLISSFKKIAVDQTHEEMSHFFLSEYINEILLSYHHKFKKTQITVETLFPASEQKISSYPGAIIQIMTNFLMNSYIHAFDNGKNKGEITITIEQTEQTTELIYQDNGKGMSEHIAKNVFQPFFTTRRGQGGSGLGMSIVYNLVTHKLLGTINCRSREDKGTTFTISMPNKL